MDKYKKSINMPAGQPKPLRIPAPAGVLLLLVLLCLSFTSCKTTGNNTPRENEIVSYSIRLAEEKVRRGLPWQAIEIYETAFKEADDWRLLYNEALVYSKMGYYPNAVELLERVRDEWEETESTWPALASIYALNGQDREAKQQYESYLRNHRDDKTVLEAYMSFCFRCRYYGEAYNAALDLWNMQVFKKEVVDVLYSVDEAQWGAVRRLFPDENNDSSAADSQ